MLYNVKSYLELAFYSLIFIAIISFIKLIFKKLVGKFGDDKISYKTFNTIRYSLNILIVITLTLLWGESLNNLIFFSSFVALGIIIVCKTSILNWLSGVYIKKRNLFNLQDRIEIDGITGDVLNIRTFNFELLEVSNKVQGQHTGIIVEIPNSFAMTKEFKNYTKNSRYIWDELNINIPLDADLAKTKKMLYEFINEVDIIKNIYKKFKQSNTQSSQKNYGPVIYTKIDGAKIVLSVRYLIDPKKSRYINSIIWNKIYDSYRHGEIQLYKGSE